MNIHVSQAGFEQDEDGFVHVVCGCGVTLGPAPDEETALDIAMDHAYFAERDVLLPGDVLELLQAVADHFADTDAPLGTLARSLLIRAEVSA